jgi:uncharacterized RDD family membrane protein YckC
MNTSTRHEEVTPATTPAAPPPGRDAGPPASTLIEFPRPGRSAKPPQWRKDLSERVREIQQRRALEAARETQQDASPAADAYDHDGAEEAAAHDAAAPQLGLVPTPEPAEVNPILVKALERLERARRQSSQPAYGQPARGGAAATAQAAARLAEETRQPEPQPHAARAPVADAPPAESQATMSQPAAVESPAPAEEIERTAEPVRTTTLVVVPTPAPPDTEAGAAIREALNRPRPRRHIPEVADDALLLRREAEVAPASLEHTEPAAATAPVARRIVAAITDLLVVAFAASPFAAIIELTSGNWHDPRVAASLGGIVLTIMFLYETVSVAFSGRTWGMMLFSLRAVDWRTGLIPTTGQCARRALAHIVSLATLGLPLLPALFDSEGRAAHDRLSRTVVVKE